MKNKQQLCGGAIISKFKMHQFHFKMIFANWAESAGKSKSWKAKLNARWVFFQFARFIRLHSGRVLFLILYRMENVFTEMNSIQIKNHRIISRERLIKRDSCLAILLLHTAPHKDQMTFRLVREGPLKKGIPYFFFIAPNVFWLRRLCLFLRVWDQDWIDWERGWGSRLERSQFKVWCCSAHIEISWN